MTQATFKLIEHRVEADMVGLVSIRNLGSATNDLDKAIWEACADLAHPQKDASKKRTVTLTVELSSKDLPDGIAEVTVSVTSKLPPAVAHSALLRRKKHGDEDLTFWTQSELEKGT